MNDATADIAIYTRVQASVPETMTEQLRVCRDRASAKNLNVVLTYHDDGSANADLSLRPGLRALLKDAKERKFGAVLVADLDRLSRDAVGLVRLRKELRSFGVTVLTVSRQEERDTASIIRSIFDEYLGGLSPAKIAERLNTEDGE